LKDNTLAPSQAEDSSLVLQEDLLWLNEFHFDAHVAKPRQSLV